jgi:hypothetical protein
VASSVKVLAAGAVTMMLFPGTGPIGDVMMLYSASVKLLDRATSFPGVGAADYNPSLDPP